MKTLDEISTIIGQYRDVLAEKYGIVVVGVFGSYARGEQRRRSDIDLLADVLRPISLLELVGAEISSAKFWERKWTSFQSEMCEKNCGRLFQGRWSPCEARCDVVCSGYRSEHEG